MTHRLISIYVKNYCNRTLIVKIIIENVVTCFLGRHSVEMYASCMHLYSVNPALDVCDLDKISELSRLYVEQVLQCSLGRLILSKSAKVRSIVKYIVQCC